MLMYLVLIMELIKTIFFYQYFVFVKHPKNINKCFTKMTVLLTQNR